MILRPGRAASAAVIALLALAEPACITVGPGSRPPTVRSDVRYISPAETGEPDPAITQHIPTQAITPGRAVAPEWWRLFKSPQLDGLVTEAIAGSRTLEGAKARLEAQRQTVEAARASLYPQLGLSASIARQKESPATFGLSANALPLPPNFTLFQIGPSVSYRLDLFGGVRQRIEQQSALADYQQYQLAAAYLALTGNTVMEAVQVASIRAQRQALGGILEIDRRNLQLVRTERDVGAVPDSDVVSAESQLAADETLQPGLDQQLSLAIHALAVLLGHAPADWSPPDFALSGLTLPADVPLTLPSQLVHQRPDILSAEAQLHAASAQIGIATAQFYPDITLSAGASASSLNGGDLFSPAGLVWSIAAGLTQPVFDAGMRRAQRRAALATFRAAAADYQETVLQAFRQVADILQALVHDTNLLAAQKRSLDTASRSVNLQNTNYEKGGTGILELLDAQRQYQHALVGYIGAKAQRYLDTIQLLAAMGGG
ncbi:MAG: efflux transporter, outer rane factor lipoprotein NodT family [Gammaproteobacteria bacterium]|nr:efflux transporter, outer rane factor lipoprotein NodT family [Gammaproteobacteria bacterium]